MSYKQMDVQTTDLTPEFAEYFSSLPHVEGDRDRESSKGRQRIAWLDGLLRRGEFYSPDWSMALCNGKKYRVNGGHTSLMLASANGHFPHGMKVVLRTFQCDTYRDVVELFNHFDNRKSIRSASDKINAHKALHGELAHTAPTWIAKGLAGIDCFNRLRLDMDRMDEDERTRVIHEETGFLSWAEQFVKCRHVGLVGSMAFMYHAYGIDDALAQEFYTLVTRESAPEPNHPTRVLAKYLLSCLGRDTAKPRHSDGRAQYVKCIHAWNAWQRGTTTDLKYHPSAPLPDPLVVIDGKVKRY